MSTFCSKESTGTPAARSTTGMSAEKTDSASDQQTPFSQYYKLDTTLTRKTSLLCESLPQLNGKFSTPVAMMQKSFSVVSVAKDPDRKGSRSSKRRQISLPFSKTPLNKKIAKLMTMSVPETSLAMTGTL